MLDRFRILAGGLDHPEGVAWDPVAGCVYAGGEAGQLYRIGLDGSCRQVASTGGFLLGVAVDADGRVYACDVGHGEVVRIDPASGAVATYSRGTPERPMRAPNWLAFDAAGDLYVTDSGDWGAGDGVIWRVAPGGEASIWTAAAAALPNGCCLEHDGSALLVIETNGPTVVRVPILPDGTAGQPEPFVTLPDTVPDGCALTADGRLLVSCQRPDGIFLVERDASACLLAHDPTGQLFGAPANVAFVGERLDRLVTSNLGRWHVTIGEIGLVGAPLPRPYLP